MNEQSSTRPSTTTHAKGREKLLGHLAAFSFAAVIAGSFSLGALAAPYMTPAALNGIRFVLAASILLGINLAITGRIPRIPAAPWRFAIIGGLMALYFITMFMALKITSPVSTGAVFTLIPLMSAAFGWVLMRQHTPPAVLVSLLVAAIGAIWVIFRGDLEAILSFRIGRGEAIFLLGCAGHAAVAPLVRLFSRGENGIYFTQWTVTGTMAWLLIAGAGDLVATDWSSLPVIVWIAIAYLAVFATAGSFFLLQFASMRLPSSKALSYGYLLPSIVIFYEGMLGHGWVEWKILAGALVTALALAFAARASDG